MEESIFKFKKFSIKQNSSVMKIGTDGVLLGAISNYKNANRILDIGTGTGLIALMLAQKSEAIIDGIDINEKSIELASANICNSPWKSRMNVFKFHLQEFAPDYKYDLIVSNPPYFSTGVFAPDKNRAIARHAMELPLNELIANAYRLLNEGGIFSFIYPYVHLHEIKDIAVKSRFSIKSETLIFPKEKLPAKRIIIELLKSNTFINNCTYSEIIIENEIRHDYTQQYINLTKDYYLKF
jgi:tRNA1Val (adenine37-N6)-methyltransferase